MKILYSVDPEVPVPPVRYGGIERIVAGLITEMRARGHRVAVVSNSESTILADKKCTWASPRSAGYVNILKNKGVLKKSIAEVDPDILHSFSRLAYMLGSFSRPPRKIMSYQRLPSPHTVKWAHRIAGKNLTFTGCSQYIAEVGRRVAGCWIAIPNFVDINQFTAVSAVPPDAPLVFLSRIARIKGTHVAIEVAKRAGRRLIIAGNHSDTVSDRQYWREEIAPRLGNGVEYVGAVDDAEKNKLLGQASALLVPIQWDEPFGIVFVEALACGTPVISCPRGALPEIVVDGKHGYLAKDINTLVAAVRSIDQVSRGDCRDRAVRNFSTRCIADRYEQLYEQVVRP